MPIENGVTLLNIHPSVHTKNIFSPNDCDVVGLGKEWTVLKSLESVCSPSHSQCGVGNIMAGAEQMEIVCADIFSVLGSHHSPIPSEVIRTVERSHLHFPS